MEKLRPLEDLSKVNGGDLIGLHLASDEHCSEIRAKQNIIAGYINQTKNKFSFISGMANPNMQTYNAVERMDVDLSRGRIFGSDILGFEIIREYNPKGYVSE